MTFFTPMTARETKWIAAVVTALMLTVTGTGHAAEEPAIDEGESVESLVERLSDADHETRHLATTGLMAHPGLTDEELGRLIRQSDEPERRHRLIRVAMHRFYAAHEPEGVDPFDEAGSLGIVVSSENVVKPEQRPGLTGPAMLVTSTQPGFPAHLQLRVGDLIEGIDNRMFGAGFSDEWFREEIKGHKAGDVVNFHVLREDRHLTLEIRLERYARLKVIDGILQQNGSDPNQYQPWKGYLNRLMLGEGVSIPRIVPDVPRADGDR